MLTPRTIHILNRLLGPIVDLAFVLAIVTAIFFGIGFFYETFLPWIARLANP